MLWLKAETKADVLRDVRCDNLGSRFMVKNYFTHEFLPLAALDVNLLNVK